MRTLMRFAFSLSLSLSLSACFASHELAGDEDSPPESGPIGRWVFASGPCNDDHTFVVQLCDDGSAQSIGGHVSLATPDPVDRGRFERTGSRIRVELAREGVPTLQLEYDERRDVLSFLDRRSDCVEPEAHREREFLAAWPSYLDDWGDRAYVHHLPRCP